ncbi:efflux RND transporter periplasmic adaptor subunit [Parasphingorhabdus cellanae]|uniref:Efflux RND transporter periplasmic adaptor subunit n=1 Tax=Parasphingorhabdus cellanae TaxID=2806553 RepID=A0ABX7T1G8_9SPHN|nr:efflux RND transporter periplasmic adaptor subunit [Parasphingorhabdus cellanae]QTD55001.1 efflux RND transporter periplasmic adaptor subunit [Parasphingorhabdus cellanae]
MTLYSQKSLALVAMVLLTACGQSEADEKRASDEPIPAATIVVSSASQNETITAAGTVRLRRETELGFTTSGQVASVRYEEGDRVKRGALLAALDTSTVSADLESAKAERDRAQAEFDRIKSLYADGWVTKARLEQAEAATRAAKAQVNASGFASRTAQITAPSNGIILTRNIDAGQIVNAGTTALVLGETDKGFVLKVPMTDADASRIRTGMRANVAITAISDQPFESIVSEKDGRADEQTGTFEVSFRLPGNEKLRSGQLGTVEIEVTRSDDGAIAVPATAIFGVRSGEGLVFVVDEKNRVKQRNVVIGELTDDVLEITSGLNDSDVVVTRGVEKLRDGDRIKPIRASK